MQKTKLIKYDDEAQLSNKAGVDKLANLVKVTLGPGGNTVVIEDTDGKLMFTKDGVTVARNVIFDDAFEEAGAKIIREVASRTEELTGDGTTTSSVLAQKIIELGLKYQTVGANKLELKRGIDKAVDCIVTQLDSMATDVKNPADIATISANNDVVVGKVIGKVLDKIGRNGVVDVEDGAKYGVDYEMNDGMTINAGYTSPYMITDFRNRKAVIKKPYILITDRDLSSIDELKPILQKITNSGKKELLIICNNIESGALVVVAENTRLGNIKAIAIKSPGFGDDRKEQLHDIAAMVDAQIISKDTGMKIEDVELEHLGYADKVVTTQYETTIVGAKGNVKERVAHLKQMINKTTLKYRKEQYEKRLGRLTGGVAVLQVGAPTESELQEMKYRIEDAVNATKAAMKSGVVPGGGVALIRASKELDKLKVTSDEKAGVELIREAVLEPLRQICENCGIDSRSVLEKVEANKNINFGFNADKHVYGDMIKMGIIDPVDVTKSALQNAASIANVVLYSRAIAVNKPDERPSKN